MRIKTQAEELARALDMVTRAVPTRTTIPLLQGILFNVTDKLELTATNNEMKVKTECDVAESEAGSCVFPMTIASIVKSFPKDAEISIEASGKKATVKCANSNFKVVVESADLYPNTETKSKKKCVISGETLKDMIGGTAFAASNDEARGAITGVLTELKDGELSMVAIDGFRLALKKTELAGDEFSVIIPKKTLLEIGRLISDDDVEIEVGEKNVVVVDGKTVVTSKILADKFVDYKAIIPKDNNTSVKIEKDALRDAIDRVLLVTTGLQDRLVVVHIDDELKISAESEGGDAKETIETTHDGEVFDIGFNGSYLLEALKTIEDDETTLLLKDAISAVLIKGEGYMHLVLPVRMNK